MAQSDRLKSDVNAGIEDSAKFVGIGKTYTLSGDPPVTRSWRKSGVGLFAGFSTSTAAIKAFCDPAGEEKKATSAQTAEASQKTPATTGATKKE